MKKYSGSFLILAFCLLAANSVFGQSTADVRKEFNDFREKSQKLRRVKSYRIKTTIEVFDGTNEKLKHKLESVRESVPPDRSRYPSTFDDKGKIKKFELINIGEKRYVRENDGEWKLDETEPTYGIGVGASTNIKLIEETTFNGQPVKVFEETGSSSSGENSRDFVRKYWFTSEGELLKDEEESKDSKTKNITRSVTIYEFDANIKIEAPVKSKTN